MSISKPMQESINQQINHELYSSYLYLAMAAHFEATNLPGFAHWMRKQSQEEYSHAMKLFDFLVDREGVVELRAIPQPPTEYEAPMGVMEQVLEHERKVTSLINGLYEQALKEADYPVQVYLHWFISEQVEEEKAASDIIEQLKLVNGHSDALLLLDRHMGERV